MNKTCEFCIWWKAQYEDDDTQFGICSNLNVNDDVRIAEENNFNDEVIFTAETFGCIWFEKQEKVVTEIKLPKK
jgi:hypothetical protein